MFQPLGRPVLVEAAAKPQIKHEVKHTRTDLLVASNNGLNVSSAGHLHGHVDMYQLVRTWAQPWQLSVSILLRGGSKWEVQSLSSSFHSGESLAASQRRPHVVTPRLPAAALGVLAVQEPAECVCDTAFFIWACVEKRPGLAVTRRRLSCRHLPDVGHQSCSRVSTTCRHSATDFGRLMQCLHVRSSNGGRWASSSTSGWSCNLVSVPVIKRALPDFVKEGGSELKTMAGQVLFTSWFGEIV